MDAIPLARAQAKCEQLECELQKLPDFQHYLRMAGRAGRHRMERELMANPKFRMWSILKASMRKACPTLTNGAGQLGHGAGRVEKPVAPVLRVSAFASQARALGRTRMRDLPILASAPESR
jgi:hypothetical protein